MFAQLYLFFDLAVNYFAHEYFRAIIVKFEEKHQSEWVIDLLMCFFSLPNVSKNCFVKNIYSQAVTNGMGNETTQLLLNTGTKLSLTLTKIDFYLEGWYIFSYFCLYHFLKCGSVSVKNELLIWHLDITHIVLLDWISISLLKSWLYPL